MQQYIKVTLELQDTPSPKQGFLIWDDDKWSFRLGRKNNLEKNPTPLNDFINAAPNLIECKQLLQRWVCTNKIHDLQEIYTASTQVVRSIILANSAKPYDISEFAIRHLLQGDTLESEKHVSAIYLFSTVPPK